MQPFKVNLNVLSAQANDPPGYVIPGLPNIPSWRGVRLGSYSGMRSLAVGPILPNCLRVLDIVVVFCMVHLLMRSGGYARGIGVLVPACAAILHCNVVQFLGGYPRLQHPESWLSFVIPVASWTLIDSVMFASTVDYSRMGKAALTQAVTWYAFGLMFLLMSRIGIRTVEYHFGRRGILARTVAVVDASGEGEVLARELERNSGGEVRLIGVFRPIEIAAGRPNLDDLIALGQSFHIDEIIIAAGQTGKCLGDKEIRRRLCELSTRVWLCPFSSDAPKYSAPAELVYGNRMYGVQARPLNDAERAAKRLFDLVVSAVLLVLLSPLLFIVAFAVLLSSPGPVIFKQQRLGFNNQVIVVWKFRSMRMMNQPEKVVVQAKRSDPRVTRVGAFLRKTSLDELPQLFNVLIGSMSLVGPRPHALQHNEFYTSKIDEYLGRHRVQPGITGWAQVNGFRGETDALVKMERRIDHDLAYIENWSLLMDIRILLMTPFCMFFHPNAY